MEGVVVESEKQVRNIVLRDHCFRGHEWTKENSIMSKDPRSKNGIRRQCRTCKREGMRMWRKMNGK